MSLLIRQQEQILYKQIPAFILCLYIMKCRRRIVKRTDILTDQRPVRGELVEVLQTVTLKIHIILVCFLSFTIPEKPVLVEVVDRDLLLPNKGAVFRSQCALEHRKNVLKTAVDRGDVLSNYDRRHAVALRPEGYAIGINASVVVCIRVSSIAILKDFQD